MARGAKRLRRPHLADRHERIGWWDALPCHDVQAGFVASPARHNYFVGGVGTGKTVALCDRNIMQAMSSRRGLVHCMFARTGRDLRDVILPTFMQRVDLFEEHTGIKLVARWRPSDSEIAWVSGARTIFRPYEKPDKYRGLNLASAQVDEAEFAVGDPCYAVFTVINSRIRTGPPELRSLDIASSPNGDRGVIKVFRQRIADGDQSFREFHATMFDNPFLFDLGRPCKHCQGESPLCPPASGCGGTGLESDYISSMQASMSRRQWRQEGMGEVLLPLSAVFGDSYAPAQHVIPWKWDPRLPWVLCIDWGEAHAYFCAVQILPRPMRLRSGRVLPAGSWIVAAERKMELTSRPRFRRALLSFVNDGDFGRGKLAKPPGLPYWIATDRAVREENQWIQREFGGKRGEHGRVRVDWCRSRDQQEIKHGVGMLDYMLAPNVGPPRLYLADSLIPASDPAVGMLGAMQGYSYVLNKHTRQPTEVFDKDDVHDHPIDALRYGIVTSSRHPFLHGGERLPYLSRYGEVAEAA